jgi:1-pyrroline-5-carboxylate dehydrogenase
MLKGFFNTPTPVNEPVLNYGPRSVERFALKAALAEGRSKVTDIPMYIGNKLVRTGKTAEIRPPHDHQHLLATYHEGDASHVHAAIDAALAAKAGWENLPWEERAAIFLKAADLLSGPYRARINAATMLGQSKNAYQAEIDAACEMVDFLRFNVAYMSEIYAQQPPVSPKGIWNRVEYRPL